MQLTLQAEEIHRFNRIVHWVICKPKYMTVHFVVFRGRPALAIHRFDWTIVMPIRGRKPPKPFKVPYRYLQHLPPSADGKVVVKIHPKKGIGQVHWSESGEWDFTPPFSFGLADFSAVGAPDETGGAREYPMSLLDDIWRSAKLCLNPKYPNLCRVHITPGGELRSTDGTCALGIQTPYTFDIPDQTMIGSFPLFGKRELRKRKSFRLSLDRLSLHFDFADFHFWTKPNEHRFPDINKTFPNDETTETCLTLDPADAAFLKKHLDGLPGRKEHDAPVTLACDYDHTVSVHGSQAEREKTKAILLARSSYEGDAYVVQTNRKHLLQALSLGCLDFRFGTSYPLALAENRRFCWSPLDGSALPLESERPLKPVVVLRSDQPFTEKEKP